MWLRHRPEHDEKLPTNGPILCCVFTDTYRVWSGRNLLVPESEPDLALDFVDAFTDTYRVWSGEPDLTVDL